MTADFHDIYVYKFSQNCDVLFRCFEWLDHHLVVHHDSWDAPLDKNIAALLAKYFHVALGGSRSTNGILMDVHGFELGFSLWLYIYIYISVCYGKTIKQYTFDT